MASIGSYLSNPTLSYSADYVARFVFGNDCNHPATMQTAMSALKNIYGISYTNIHELDAPPAQIIRKNLVANAPIYTSWRVEDTTSSHACVVRGITASELSLYIMDPEYDFDTASKDVYGVYGYKSGYSNNWLYLDGYASSIF